LKHCDESWLDYIPCGARKRRRRSQFIEGIKEMSYRTHKARKLAMLQLPCAFVLCVVWFMPAAAQQKHTHVHPAPEPRPAQTAQSPSTGRPGVIRVGYDEVAIPDVEVLDQNGRKVRFYTDLFKDRVVVVSFFFTSCTLMCPLQGQYLAKLQTALGDKMGKEVFFISVSKDPKVDTPQRLSLWARRYEVKTGWTLVTGTETIMRPLLWDLIGEEPGPQLHNPVVLIGNDRTGVWEDAEGLSSPDKLIEVIERVAAAKSHPQPSPR
jgi:cytochrome oxidase Cu insertion factor (SCO1/SenC/PrrC family)